MATLVISHIRILRETILASLGGSKDTPTVGAFSRETVAAGVSECAPTLVVIDASHPEAHMLAALTRASAPGVRIVVLATCEADEKFLSWADIGISAYLAPENSSRDLLAVVRRVQAGEVVCAPRQTAILLNRYAERSHDHATRSGIHVLTLREREVAGLLADGLSNKLIARRMHIAISTVKNHIHSILEKWNVASRGEAAARYRLNAQSEREPAGQWNAMLPTSHAPQRKSLALHFASKDGPTIAQAELLCEPAWARNPHRHRGPRPNLS